ncbi:MAG TPA: IS1182 family transposase [Acidimicrobiia bacterium]
MDSLLARLFAGDEDSFYARLARHGDELIRDDDFAACYANGRGRPSIPPSLLMKAVLLQIRDDVSDREAARRAAKDLDWKRALRLETEDIPFHHTTLSVFRSRLLLNDADETVLKTTIARAVERGLFAKKVLAIADSTGVMGAAAVADTYELIRQAVAKLVEAAGGPKALASRLRRGARAVVRGKAAIDWADASARRQELGRLVALARDLLAVTAGNEEAAEARELLGRIIDQDVEDTDDGPAIRQGVASDRVISVVDPEMRHSRKSPSKRLDGYKAHVVTDHGTELVLGVSATPANVPDGPELAPLIASAHQAGVPIAEVLGDTAYGDGDTREAVEETGAKVTAKTQPSSTTGVFPKSKFIIDPAIPAATCPAGHTTTQWGWTKDHQGRRVPALTFGAARCRACPLREHCTTSPAGRRIMLNFHEARLQAARLENERPATRRKLRRRSLVERKLAELKMHGMRKTRYRGARKVLLQLRFTAAVVNTKRLFTLEGPDANPATA